MRHRPSPGRGAYLKCSSNVSKKRKIINVASLYLKKLKNIPPCRFDVVSIYYAEGRAEVELIRDAFEA